MKNKNNVLVLGLGVSGLSVIKYFSNLSQINANEKNLNIYVFDTRDNPPNLDIVTNLNNVIVLTKDELQNLLIEEFKYIVISPGLDPRLEDIKKLLTKAKNSKVEIIGEIELFARCVKPTAKVVAITGSNGKSTVTTLVGLMAKEAGIKVAVGGNLGTPAMELLNDDIELYILELSSFQLDTLYSLKPYASVVLNISADHLDRYKDLEEYQKSKLKIYNNAKYSILNSDSFEIYDDIKHVLRKDDEEFSIYFGLSIPSKKNHFGVISEGTKRYLAKGENKIINISELNIIGEQNISNALAAMALASTFKVSDTVMVKVLKDFRGLEHRCEIINTNDGIVWVNDSKGTNVGATIAALKGLRDYIKGSWILILGGISKNTDFSELVSYIKDVCNDVIVIGDVKDELNSLLSKYINVHIANTMHDAVSTAKGLVSSGDGVLLSPACASFDMFKNYMHRGDEFKKQVAKVAN